jgi:hypothetical protein
MSEKSFAFMMITTEAIKAESLRFVQRSLMGQARGVRKRRKSKEEECRMQNDLGCGCYALTPSGIQLMRQTALVHLPIPPPGM